MGAIESMKHEKLFDEATEQEIIEKYKSGMLTTYLAKDYYCHRHTITRLLKRRGVELDGTRRSASVLSSEDIEEIIKRYRKGESARTLAVDFGCSHKRITNLLREQGVKIVKNRRKPKSGPELLIPFEELIPHYLDKPKTLDEIAKIFNTSRTTVKKNVLRHKLELIPVYERRKMRIEYDNTHIVRYNPNIKEMRETISVDTVV